MTFIDKISVLEANTITTKEFEETRGMTREIIMGIASGISSQLSGKVGMVVFRQMKNGKTVVLENRRKKGVPRRSEKQMCVRMQWGKRHWWNGCLIRHGRGWGLLISWRGWKFG